MSKSRSDAFEGNCRTSNKKLHPKKSSPAKLTPKLLILCVADKLSGSLDESMSKKAIVAAVKATNVFKLDDTKWLKIISNLQSQRIRTPYFDSQGGRKGLVKLMVPPACEPNFDERRTSFDEKYGFLEWPTSQNDESKIAGGLDKTKGLTENSQMKSKSEYSSDGSDGVVFVKRKSTMHDEDENEDIQKALENSLMIQAQNVDLSYWKSLTKPPNKESVLDMTSPTYDNEDEVASPDNNLFMSASAYAKEAHTFGSTELKKNS